MTIQLSIGGYRISLRENAGRPLFFWPAQSYQKFEVADGGAADLHFDVEVCDSLPNPLRGKLLFDAGKDHWKLYARDGGFLLEAVDPKDGKLLNLAQVSADFCRGTFWTAQGAPWSPSRLINPLVEVCLLTKLARDGGLMLHAAGVDFRGDGYIFTGPSGAGKSTLSGLFVDRGALILNDERVIVRDAAGAPIVHGTPWCGSNPVVNCASAPLRALSFISHGKNENRVSPLSAVQAASLCLKQAFLPYWDAAAMEKTVASSEALFRTIPRRAYAFLNDSSAVEGLLAEAPFEKVS